MGWHGRSARGIPPTLGQVGLAPTREADPSDRLVIPFHEALIETNALGTRHSSKARPLTANPATRLPTQRS